MVNPENELHTDRLQEIIRTNDDLVVSQKQTSYVF